MLTIAGMIYGNNSAPRKKLRPKNRLLSNSASATPSRTWRSSDPPAKRAAHLFDDSVRLRVAHRLFPKAPRFDTFLDHCHTTIHANCVTGFVKDRPPPAAHRAGLRRPASGDPRSAVEARGAHKRK